MGAGYAVYCRPGAGDGAVEICREQGFDAIVAGVVEEGKRRVVIEPLGIEYLSEALSLR
jgi:phosphoribosylformylglycinamidine cyclo-ligase